MHKRKTRPTGAAITLAVASAVLLGAPTASAAAHATRPAGYAPFSFSPPVINQGGVVNGVDYRADDIHPGTVVAIFGEWFLPADTVIVDQGSSEWTIGAGSAWWYDSGGQINATLPTDLQLGQATITILTSAGQYSNAAAIDIS